MLGLQVRMHLDSFSDKISVNIFPCWVHIIQSAIL